MSILLKEPKTEQEFSAYYDLRWRILRKPWSQPRGSEKDNMEDSSCHVMALDEKTGKILGVARLHLNTDEEAQVRYMAVEKGYKNQGVGRKMLKKLEEHARNETKAKRIILNARENATGFYEKSGYKIKEEGHTLFGEIKHYVMEKEIF